MLKARNIYAVILAGGSGERFWPLSTRNRPKQFLSVPTGEPLIAATVRRIQELAPPRQIFIITRSDLVPMTRKALPAFPKQNIIGEPCGRDTAAAVALGAALVKRQNPRAAFCVLTSDHVIGTKNVFLNTLRESFRLALAQNVLVTIGIPPVFPSVGFGYIETGRRLHKTGRIEFWKAKRFVEKPDLPTAEKYVRQGGYYWNSGMFIWSVSALEAAMAAHQPKLLGLIASVAASEGNAHFTQILKREYQNMERISVDYAIMEKADNIIMAKGNFAWDDVGSWAALEEHCRKDQHGNVVIGKGEALESHDNISVAEDGMVALIGVRNLVVVRTGAATLVCAKDKAQDVKKMVHLLKTRGKYKDVL